MPTKSSPKKLIKKAVQAAPARAARAAAAEIAAPAPAESVKSRPQLGSEERRALVAISANLAWSFVAVAALVLIFGDGSDSLGIISSVAWAFALLGIFLGYFASKK